jgi:type IX secretion system PorP/SprF family membrane protein
MLKRFIIILFVFMAAQAAMAQLYPVFSQYYFNELVINPAYAGSHVQLSATTTYRQQWINFPGAPKTMSFSAHSSFLRGKVGVGLMFNADKIGSYANKDIQMSYSYKIKMPHATFSFGLQGMMYFVGADFSKLNLKDPADAAFSLINQMKPNVGAGLYYNRKNFFLGFSVPFLINSSFREISTQVLTDLKQKRNYFLRGGIIRNMDSKGNFKFNPSFLVRAQEGQPLSADINAAVIFYDILSTGISYRSGDAIISFISLKLADQLHFNYSYDFTSSSLRPFSSGTHEFMLNYRYKISRVHKNLPCPTYWNYRE